MTSYVVLLRRADVLPPCLSSRSGAARAVTALGAGTTHLKIEQLRHRQLPPAAAIGYLLPRSAAATPASVAPDESSKMAELLFLVQLLLLLYVRFLVSCSLDPIWPLSGKYFL